MSTFTKEVNSHFSKLNYGGNSPPTNASFYNPRSKVQPKVLKPVFTPGESLAQRRLSRR